jgi:hypothetical protein
MNVERSMANGITGELWAYLRERKKWWLAPVILMMLFVGAVLVFAQGSALAPFIYTIF